MVSKITFTGSSPVHPVMLSKIFGFTLCFQLLFFMFILQLSTNFLLFLISLLGIVFNRQSILITLMCIELMLLSLNLNFIVFSVYLDDMYGQIFSIFILTVAAAESSIGLAIIIIYYRVRGSISLEQNAVLKH